MGFYEDRIVPRLVDVALSGKQFTKTRAKVCSELSGEVLEIGFGSGRNVPHYPGTVTRVLAIDPALLGRQLAAKRVAASSIPVEYVGLDGAHLPVDDASMDHVLTTWTLCTIPDVEQALTEAVRVLKPGGSLHFVEHGRSQDPKVVTWQDRLTPIQKRIAGGCHLNRQIDQLIEASGLQMTRIEEFDAPGPKSFSHLFMGVATKA